MEAALALVAAGAERDIVAGARRAEAAIDGGAARAILARWAAASREA
jgi:anthranilate phosphoribosyltransferase